MATEVFTRKDLYNLVWSASLVSLSKKYNISDNGLRKICVRMNIPLPKAGHWIKLQFGKKVRITHLPESSEVQQEVTLSLRTVNDNENYDPDNPLKSLTNEIKKDTRLLATVPAKLNYPDSLIIAAKERLTGKDVFHPYHHKGIVGCKWGELDIRVAPKNVKRALLFMDTFIKALRARGHELKLRNECTYAIVRDQDFKISLREKMKKVVVHEHWTRTEFHPINILAFSMDGYRNKEWKDGKQMLEFRLPEILARLEIVSDELTKEQLYHQNMRDERERKEQLLKDIQKRKEKELFEFKNMLEKAERWHKAVNLRNYINAIEQHAISNNGISEDLKNWLEWSRRKADWYDPFIEAKDDLLQEADQANLSFK